MRTFICSRGYEQHLDYAWIEIMAGEERRLDTENVPHYANITTLGGLRNGEGPAFALGRFGPELALLLDALPSLKRRDFMGRRIYDSILWLAEAAEEETLRLILAHLLRDAENLPEAMDSMLLPMPDTRFRLDRSALSTRLSHLKAGGENVPQAPDERQVLRALTPENRTSLADELARTSLPQREGLLVLVVASLPAQKATRAGIWRALTRFGGSQQPASAAPSGNDKRPAWRFW